MPFLSKRGSSLFSTLLLALALTGSAVAGPIFVPAAGAVTATLVVNSHTFATEAFDVRSTAGQVSVYDPGFLGTITLSDGGNSVPNSYLAAFNSAFTEAGLLTFDGLNGVVSGADFLVGTTAAPITSITDPALNDMLKPLVFDFSITSGSVINEDLIGFSLTLNQIVPVGSPVPEPATASFLLCTGLLGFAFRRRFRVR